MSETLMRLPEVRAAVGLSRPSIYRLIHLGRFPRPVQLGLRSVGWYADEIAAWVKDRPRAGGRVAAAVGARP